MRLAALDGLCVAVIGRDLLDSIDAVVKSPTAKSCGSLGLRSLNRRRRCR
ncbi:hypothetical protein CGRA01v4_07091 [Colletotrichum graminicola]|nr:hypothetical protein CGRA01v4_07091 [Colletotrichum graminicola]